MKILVNGTPLLAPLTGIGQYIRHLYSAMERNPEADLHLYYGSRIEKGIRLPSPGAVQSVQRTYSALRKILPRPRMLRRLAEKIVFTHQTRGKVADFLYHEPNYVPLPYKGPLVITVCDLSCFDHPETHPAERVKLFKRDMPSAVERADHIVVISEASKAALQRWFNVPSSKVTITYLAADPRFRPYASEELAPALAQLALTSGEYVLCVGTLEPRKNLATLFAAYAGLPSSLRRRYPLVVAGMSGWNTQGLLKSASDLINKGEIRLLGYVADELVPPLYAGAAAFAYPSRYEGFGLPALEAMASGIPVLTGNKTSLPEVVGNAGLMVDPDDVDGMRDCLRQFLEDRLFAQKLGNLGRLRANDFSWDRCARETYAVYEQVMREKGG